MEIKKFQVRKYGDFGGGFCEGVQLTSENADEVAMWCGGTKIEQREDREGAPTHAAIILNPHNSFSVGRIGRRAEEGDWVIKSFFDDGRTGKADWFMTITDDALKSITDEVRTLGEHDVVAEGAFDEDQLVPLYDFTGFDPVEVGVARVKVDQGLAVSIESLNDRGRELLGGMQVGDFSIAQDRVEIFSKRPRGPRRI